MAETPTAAPAFTRAHFIGIGGAGMSGIALVLHERGYVVTGSDLKTSRYIRQLTRAGVDIRIGHRAETIDEASPDVVVVSTAIPETNPELARARELGIPVWPRAKMLSALGAGYTTVAVAGTHGKTTTSSMVATMLDRMGEDPSFLIGGIVEGYDTNGRNGHGPYFVAEADESDSSFSFSTPTWSWSPMLRPITWTTTAPCRDRAHLRRVHGPGGRGWYRRGMRRFPTPRRAGALDGSPRSDLWL